MFQILPMSEESNLAVAHVIGLGLWGTVAAVIVWRAIMLVIRHRRADLRRRILAPLASALIVGTEGLGFPPVTVGDIVPQSTAAGGILDPKPRRSADRLR